MNAAAQNERQSFANWRRLDPFFSEVSPQTGVQGSENPTNPKTPWAGSEERPAK
jgi:hypothetical protein